MRPPVSNRPCRSFLSERVRTDFDPTKLQKSRGFRQTSKPHAGSGEKSAGPSELWTETPAERAKRMEDEVLGKRRRTENSGTRDEEEDRRAEEEERKRRRRDEEMRLKVEQHNVRPFVKPWSKPCDLTVFVGEMQRSAKRSETLIDLHGQARDAVESGKSAAQREKEKKEETIWDRDSMMGSAGKLIGEKDRSKMVKDARGLGGRFGSGSFL